MTNNSIESVIQQINEAGWQVGRLYQYKFANDKSVPRDEAGWTWLANLCHSDEKYYIVRAEAATPSEALKLALERTQTARTVEDVRASALKKRSGSATPSAAADDLLNSFK